MRRFDQQNFSFALKKRLEEVFPVDIHASKPTRKTVLHSNDSALLKLKKILLSMEWEVEDDTLEEYLDEIEKLQKLFRDNDHCLNLLKLQFLYGKYIQYYQHKLPLNTYKRIYSLYISTSRILYDKSLSSLKKKNIVASEIRKFKEFKKYFSVNKISDSRQNVVSPSNRNYKKIAPKQRHESVKSTAQNDNQVFDDYVFKIILELKNFFKKELNDIKVELYKWQKLQINEKKS